MKQCVRIGFLFLLQSFSFISSGQEGYATIENIYYGSQDGDVYEHQQCQLDFYYPTDGNNYKTVVWFHGGGLTGGKREIPAQLREKGIAVIGVGYRLTPNVTVQTCLEDAARAVAWSYTNINRYGGDSLQLYISGHSAGGYLTLMVGLDKSYLSAYGIDPNCLAALCPMSAQVITHFAQRKQEGLDALKPTVDKLAPLFYVRKDAPRTVLYTGGAELELYGRYEENRYFWRMMQLVGHADCRIYQFDGYDHGGMTLPAFPLLLQEVLKRD